MSGLTIIERGIVWIVCAMLGAFVALTALTEEHWLRLDSLTIEDTVVGQPAPLDFRRTYFRPFDGHWQISVWHLIEGEWDAYCIVEGPFPFIAQTPPPRHDLEWLTNGTPRCYDLPPGSFRVRVAITANPRTIFSRTAIIESNVFEVRGV